jgi:hypothetical protein
VISHSLIERLAVLKLIAFSKPKKTVFFSDPSDELDVLNVNFYDLGVRCLKSSSRQ